jgi:hypothetical protein
MRETDGWRGHVVRLLLLVSQPLMSVALSPVEDAPPPVRSTRGVQHKDPLISDDFVVGCIMIMFLLLFCFGERSCPRAWQYYRGHGQPPRLNPHRLGRCPFPGWLPLLCAPLNAHWYPARSQASNSIRAAWTCTESSAPARVKRPRRGFLHITPHSAATPELYRAVLREAHAMSKPLGHREC